MASRLGWTVVRIPFDVSKVWGTRGQMKVKGVINGFQLRGSLFDAGGGAHFLLVIEKAAWMTPSPGGVGPLTIAMLMRNTLDAFTRRRGL